MSDDRSELSRPLFRRVIIQNDVSYQRPIIIEIFCELFFEPSSFTFSDMLEMVPPLQRAGFVSVESADIAELSSPDLLDENTDARRIQIPRFRCWAPDKTRLVQLSPDCIVMNLVSPEGTYPGWDRFVHDLVEPTCQKLHQHVPRARPRSLSLNTIDRFTIDRNSAIGDYLNCGGPRIPKILSDITQAFDYDIGRGVLPVDHENRQIHISARRDGVSKEVTIHAVFHESIGASELILSKLEQLHDDANEVFESLITDRTRNEIMKGDAYGGSL